MEEGTAVKTYCYCCGIQEEPLHGLLLKVSGEDGLVGWDIGGSTWISLELIEEDN